MAVTTTSRDGIAVITFDNPPVNGMGLAVRRGLLDALAAANADDAVSGVVITGGGKVFSGGADIKEFNTPRAEQAPNLHDVIAKVEASPKPVCIAINGTALGGGLELSLGANYRVANAKADVGLPEVKIGILPGAGGTQRLPRVVGLETALNMIVSGASVPAGKLAGTALFDAVVEGDPVDAAVELLKQKIADGAPHPRVRDRKVEHDDAEALLAWARMGVAAASANYPAPLRCVDAVAASLKPFDAGMAVEREGFTVLLNSPESKALRHAFFGERAALATNAHWRPVVATVCDALGCSVPAWREPAAFVMLARDVIAVPERPGVLRVQASFRNDARWAQAWPALVLTLSDADNRTLGTRRFLPRDYLGDTPASSLLAPGQATQLAFDIVEPAPNVVAFDFRFD
ncbi:MAG: DUF3426 domain-containing protein [Thermomonas sp.]